jgi:hypothetical protein
MLAVTNIFFFSFSILNLSTFNLFHLSNILSIDEIAIPIGNISIKLTTKVYRTSSVINRPFTSTQDIKEFLLQMSVAKRYDIEEQILRKILNFYYKISNIIEKIFVFVHSSKIYQVYISDKEFKDR